MILFMLLYEMALKVMEFFKSAGHSSAPIIHNYFPHFCDMEG